MLFCSGGTQLRKASADTAQSADQRIAGAADFQSAAVGFRIGALILRQLIDSAPDGLIHGGCIHICEQTAFADRHHCSVTKTTAQGGSVRCSLPFFSSAGCG